MLYLPTYLVYYNQMIEIPHDIIPYAFIFIFLIFIVAIKKKKKPKSADVEKSVVFDDKEKLRVLEIAEKKLVALRDLYHQELIDVKVYINKTELIASKLSNEIGNNIMDIPELQKKIIFRDLKKEIKKKIDYNDPIESKTNIDKLISAVDKKIRTGNIYEEK